MTVPALASVICLASGIFGRPAWSDAECTARAEIVLDVAEKHDLDPLLLAAIDVWECDMQRKDAPVYREVRGRRRLVGHDACPMGVRVIGVERRARLDDRDLHELAAERLARWRRWCERGHPGKRYRGPRGPHHFVLHYNQGSATHWKQVLALRAVLAGKKVPAHLEPDLVPRAREHIRRLRQAFVRRSS